MKCIKWMLAALLAVAITAPAFAQSRDPHANEKWADNKAAVSAAIERAAVKPSRRAVPTRTLKGATRTTPPITKNAAGAVNR